MVFQRSLNTSQFTFHYSFFDFDFWRKLLEILVRSVSVINLVNVMLYLLYVLICNVKSQTDL